MIFHDSQVDALDLSTPEGMQELIEIHLCGHPKLADLRASDAELLREFVTQASSIGVTFQQLNEILLVLNQDRLSRAFLTSSWTIEIRSCRWQALREEW
jgi:hypothetical protein